MKKFRVVHTSSLNSPEDQVSRLLENGYNLCSELKIQEIGGVVYFTQSLFLVEDEEFSSAD